MRLADFFADFHPEHYSEFVEHELSRIFQDTSEQDKFFEFDDVPL